MVATVWTDSMLATLRSMVEQQIPKKAMAERLGLSWHTISDKMRELHLTVPAANNWSETEIATLRRMRAEGLPISVVAKETGRSVHGVHAMIKKLAGGAVPLDGKEARLRAKDMARALPKLESLGEAATVAAAVPEVIVEPVTGEVIDFPVTARRTVFYERKPGGCQWPIGTPGTAGFKFCSEMSVSGKPYCRAHCARAYMPRPSSQRREG